MTNNDAKQALPRRHARDGRREGTMAAARRGGRMTRQHNRRLRAGTALTAALVATLAACTSSPRGDATTSTPTPTASGSTSQTPSAAPSPTLTPTALPVATNVTFTGPLGLTTPSGWRTTSRFFGQACLAPRGPAPLFNGCPGLDVYYGWDSYLPGEELGNFPDQKPT